MRLTMGPKFRSFNNPGDTEMHFGFKFIVQEDLTAITEDMVPGTDDRTDELLEVAAIEIETGRLLEHKTPAQLAEDAAKKAKELAKEAERAAAEAKAKDQGAGETEETEKPKKRGPGRPKLTEAEK